MSSGTATFCIFCSIPDVADHPRDLNWRPLDCYWSKTILNKVLWSGSTQKMENLAWVTAQLWLVPIETCR